MLDQPDDEEKAKCDLDLDSGLSFYSSAVGYVGEGTRDYRPIFERKYLNYHRIDVKDVALFLNECNDPQ